MDNNPNYALAAQKLKEQQEANKLRSAITFTLGTQPDQEAANRAIAKQSGMPLAAVQEFPEEAKQRAVQAVTPYSELVSGYPITTKSLSDPEFAKIAHDDIPNMMNLEKSSGGLADRSGVLEETTANAEKQLAYAGLIFGSFGKGDLDSVAQFIADRSKRLASVQQRLPATVRNFNKQYEDASALGLFGVIASNPSATGRMIASQIPNSVLPLGLGAAGAVGGGFVGAAAGGFVGTSIVEYGAWLDQSLQQRGTDITNPSEIKAALSDPEFMAEAKKQAALKGLTTAAVDTLFLKLGHFIPVKPGKMGKIIAGAKEVGVQSVGEGVSEYAGQYAATGQGDAKQAILEGVSSLGQSVGETAISQSTRAGKTVYNTIGEKLADNKKTEVMDLIKAAKASKTIARDADAVRQRLYEADPDSKVVISNEKGVTFFQELKPEDKARLSDAIPDLDEKIAVAQETGTDLEFTRADFVSYIAPLDGVEQLSESIAAGHGDIPAEVLKELQDADANLIPEDIYNADAATQGMTEAEQFERNFYDQLVNTGKYTPDAARSTALQARKFFETTLARVGNEKDALEIVQRTMDGLVVQAPLPQNLRDKFDSNDLFLNQAKDYFARQRRNEESRAKSETDMLGRKKEKRAKATPTPLVNYLIGLGGIERGSKIAAELNAIGYTTKSHPRLYKKEGVRGLDNIPASEFNNYFSEYGITAKEDGNGYVDQDWLLSQLREESFGNYYRTPQQVEKDQLETEYQNLRDYLGNRGIDIETASNAEIKKALAEISAQGDTLYQGGKINTESEAFKNWFGDSKVVDENGNPLVVYHGSASDIDAFDNNKLGSSTSARSAKKGFFFVNNPSVASGYAGYAADAPVSELLRKAEMASNAGNFKRYEELTRQAEELEAQGRTNENVYPTYLKIENPLEYDAEGNRWIDIEDDLNEIIDRAKSDGHDGVIIKNFVDNADYSDYTEATHYIAFNSEQIKSIFNRGTFDPNDPRILYQTTKFPSFKPEEGFENTNDPRAGDTYKLETENGFFKAKQSFYDNVNKINSVDAYDEMSDAADTYIQQMYEAVDEILNNYGYKIDSQSNSDQSKSVYWTIVKSDDKEETPVITIRFSDHADKHNHEGVISFWGETPKSIAFTTLQKLGLQNLFQTEQNNPLGSITFQENSKALINLFEKSNLSTALHESGHLYWKVLSDVAALPDAKTRFADIYADVQAVRKWVRAEDGKPLTVEQEEKIARGFEAYLMEGKAPSVDLLDAFRRFKGWLVRIYREMRNLNVNITAEIRDVFDRMLATQDEIDMVRRTDAFAADPAVLEMLTADQRAAYLKKQQKATEAAKEELLKKAIAQKEAEATEEYKREFETVKAEQEAQIMAQPVQRLVKSMRDAKERISRKEFEKLYGKETAKKMPRGIFTPDGINPAIAAEMFGFTDATQMVKALGNFVEPRQAIEKAALEIMKERYGDMLTDGTIEREAIIEMHNQQRAAAMELEYKTVAELVGVKPITMQEFKAQAKRIIGSNKLEYSRNPSIFYKAEIKAAREFGKALAAKDFAKAADAKRKQMLNHYLFRESLDLRDTVEKTFKRWGKLNKPDSKLAKSMDTDYVNAARYILSRYNVGRSGFAFDQWRVQLAMDNLELSKDLEFAMSMYDGKAKDWRELTANDFLDLKDGIENLLHVGRNQRLLTVAGKQIELVEAIDQLSKQLEKTGKKLDIADGFKTEPSKREKFLVGLLGARAALRRAEQWVRGIDGGNEGVFHDYVWNPVKSAALAYRKERAEYMERVADILKPHKERLNSSPIVADELTLSNGKPYRFENKGELIGMLMHTGNESNRDKLIRGYGWTESGLTDFINRAASEGIITKEDYDLVQQLAQVAASLKEPSWTVHKELYGFYPQSIETGMVQTPFGEIEGWYWPAVADSRKSEEASIRREQGEITSKDNSFMFPTAGRGQLKSRVQGYAKPLELSIRLLPSHIDKQLRFIHLDPAVKNVGKLFFNRGFREYMREYDPNVVKDMVIPWLQRSAQQTVETATRGDGGRMIDAGFRFLRMSTAAQIMMGNVMNAAQQVTGLMPLAREVGFRNMAKAYMRWASDPIGTVRSVWGTSDEMRFRQSAFIDDFQNTIADVVDPRSKFAKVKDFSLKHGYVLQRIMDVAISTPGWIAAYDKAVSEGKSHEVAVAYADSLIRNTQGTNAPEDVSRFESGTPFTRLFTMFYSYFNTQANYVASEARIIQQSGQNVSGRMFYLYMMAIAAPAMVSAMIVQGMRGELPEDDDDDGTALDDWFEWFLIENSKGALATIPVIGQLGNYTINLFNNKQFDDRISVSPIISMAENFGRAFKTVPSALFGEGDASRAVKDGLNAVGLATGLPLGQLGKPIGFVTDVAEGDSTPESGMDFVRGALTGSMPKQ